MCKYKNNSSDVRFVVVDDTGWRTSYHSRKGVNILLAYSSPTTIAIRAHFSMNTNVIFYGKR